MVDLKEKMKTNSKQKKKNKKTSAAGGAASAAVEFAAEAATNGHKATAEGLSGDEEEAETTTANGTAAAGNRAAENISKRLQVSSSHLFPLESQLQPPLKSKGRPLQPPRAKKNLVCASTNHLQLWLSVCMS